MGSMVHQISRLLFADDSIFFVKSDTRSVEALGSTLNKNGVINLMWGVGVVGVVGGGGCIMKLYKIHILACLQRWGVTQWSASISYRIGHGR
jgi:hypothetical protein